MKPRSMKRREVIALTIDGKSAYFAKPGRWDASWYTRDINQAKVWRHPDMAQATIGSYGVAWKTFQPRVIDPRTVAGYRDVPTAAEKRQRATDDQRARIAKLMGGKVVQS
jgi:hypothetical protein